MRWYHVNEKTDYFRQENIDLFKKEGYVGFRFQNLSIYSKSEVLGFDVLFDFDVAYILELLPIVRNARNTRNKRESAPYVENILKLKKWKGIISLRGKTAVKPNIVIYRCFVNIVTERNQENDRSNSN